MELSRDNHIGTNRIKEKLFLDKAKASKIVYRPLNSSRRVYTIPFLKKIKQSAGSIRVIGSFTT